jgi:hypothetical protein
MAAPNRVSLVPAIWLNVVINALFQPSGLHFVSGICLREGLTWCDAKRIPTSRLQDGKLAADEDNLDRQHCSSPQSEREALRHELTMNSGNRIGGPMSSLGSA